MPLYHCYEWENTKIAVWQLTENLEELIDAHPDGKRLYEEACSRFTVISRRREWMAVRVLLAQIMGENVHIGYLETGRPFLVNSPCKISISHTEGFVVIAWSLHNRMGVDIECDYKRVSRVAERVFSKEELKGCKDESDMTVLWSVKEAVYKLCDVSGLHFRRDMVVSLGTVFRKENTWSADCLIEGEKRHYRGCYWKNVDFVMTLVNEDC